MSEKKDCKIVQDLLPNYIENLTDLETNKYIEGHLNECTECSQVLEDMKERLESTDTNVTQKEVKYIKKFKNRVKVLKFTLLLIILLLLLMFGVTTIRKMVIISDLINKGRQYESATNYHLSYRIYTNQGYIEYETFVMDDKIKTTSIIISDKGVESIIDIRN